MARMITDACKTTTNTQGMRSRLTFKVTTADLIMDAGYAVEVTAARLFVILAVAGKMSASCLLMDARLTGIMTTGFLFVIFCDIAIHTLVMAADFLFVSSRLAAIVTAVKLIMCSCYADEMTTARLCMICSDTGKMSTGCHFMGSFLAGIMTTVSFYVIFRFIAFHTLIMATNILFMRTGLAGTVTAGNHYMVF